MKKYLVFLVALVSFSFIFSSCQKDEITYEQSFLYGKWQSVTVKSVAHTTEYYRYVSGGTGVFWDTADDVTEAEGQKFTWTLVKAELTHIHVMEVSGGVGVTKIYTVTELTATSLKYEDDFGKTYAYTKVSK